MALENLLSMQEAWIQSLAMQKREREEEGKEKERRGLGM